MAELDFVLELTPKHLVGLTGEEISEAVSADLLIEHIPYFKTFRDSFCKIQVLDGLGGCHPVHNQPRPIEGLMPVTVVTLNDNMDGFVCLAGHIAGKEDRLSRIVDTITREAPQPVAGNNVSMYYKLSVDIEEMSTGADTRHRVRFTYRGKVYQTWIDLRRKALELAQRVLETPHALELRQFRKDNFLEIKVMVDRIEGTTVESPKEAAKDMVNMIIDEDEDWAVIQSQNMGWLVMVHLHLVEMGNRSILDPYDNMVCVIRPGASLPEHLQDLMSDYYRMVDDGDDQA